MRLGQLARKYNIKQDEVILYLNEVQAELSPFHHNSKLSDDVEALVTHHFSLSSKVIEEAIEEQSVAVANGLEEQSEDIPTKIEDQNLDVSEIDNDEKTEADLQQELDPTLPAVQAVVIEKKEEKPKENSIDTDTLMQLLESDEALSDLSGITHIKAPKKELSGLKVVGKIELPEPKSKSVDVSIDQDKAPKTATIKRPKNQQLSKEERNSRRLKIKEQKERYEARQEKHRIEAEKKKRKAQNRVRYQEKMQKAKAGQTKQEIPKEVVAPDVKDQPQVFKSISIFDRFWRLFNL